MVLGGKLYIFSALDLRAYRLAKILIYTKYSGSTLLAIIARDNTRMRSRKNQML